MSRLRELRLHGFKTFADPTRFVFQPGVNAVVGPNGSGKSNMADAVRWVLGEQSNRSLRTRRADDVIFAGSQERRPQGMAEAILTLDNADGWLPIDFAEVTIGRRAYRSGESEYLINGARARLRDVVELLGEGRLGANELVVVGQGTVDAALSLRPEERRQLFEQAAGVKNLQVRKNEALARLARARDNVTRVADLIGELRPQVKRLALQAQHATEHDALATRARALVVESHRRREQAVRTSLGEARRRAAAAEAALEDYRAEQAAGREAVAEAEARYWEADAAARRAAEAREATRESTIRAESRLEAAAARRRDAAAELDRSRRDLAEVEATLEGSQDGTVDAELEQANEAAAVAERRRQAATASLSAADDELLAAEEALAEVRRRQSSRIAEEARHSEDRARVIALRERLERELAAAIAARDEAEAAVLPQRQALEQAERAALGATERMGAAVEQLEEAQREAQTARLRSNELAERVGVLQAELDALTDGPEQRARLGSLLAAAGWRPLLDAVAAPEEAWPAIEALLGGELEQALVWRDGQLVDRLATGRGAARLLALDGPSAAGEGNGRGEALAAVAGAQTLADWVGPRAPAIFGQVAVARDVTSLLHGWRRLPAGWLAVTAEGDLADARGLLVLRGRGDPSGGAAVRRHARRRELGEALASAEAEQERAAGTAATAFARLAEAQRAREAAAGANEVAQQALGKARAASQASDERLARATRLAADLRAERAALPDAAPDARRDGGPPRTEDDLTRLTAAAERARRRRDDASAERDRARDAWQAARAEAETIEARSAGDRRDRATLEARLAQLRGLLPGQEAAVVALDAEQAAAEATVAESRAADEKTTRARRDAEATRERLRAELLALERGTTEAAARLGGLERGAQQAAVAVSRHEDALEAIARERDLALEGLPAAAADEDAAAGRSGKPPDTTGDLAVQPDEEIDAELRRVRRTLSQIGSVNPFAIEEHRELAARLEGLTTQEDDLVAAIGSTEELVARLDAEIGARFGAAFAAIGERFDEYCRLLFAGGSAALEMSDEGDGEAPGGIEIVVRPPGKRLQRLAMLSGGERALTGVALLFAMLTVNPVPFCILDEVDAALDEANIGRFADALRRLAQTIDFVVITHNRATIELADTIYGVTMTDAAVSRVLSLRLADLPVGASA